MNDDQSSTDSSVNTNNNPVVESGAAPAPVSGVATPAAAPAVDATDRRTINKVVYILITFFLGGLGIHRFMRGQIGLGILMLLLGWLTFGIWWLVDFIISLTKLSVYDGEDYIFTANGGWVK